VTTQFKNDTVYEEDVRRNRDALYNAVEGAITTGLEDADVTEVIADPSGRVYFDTIASGIIPTRFTISANKLTAIITAIAGLLKVSLADTGGILEGEMPFDGSRIEGVLPPVAINGPTLVIRKHRKAGRDGWPDLTIADYELPSQMENVLQEIVTERQNFAVIGSTSAGKTTFVNAMLNLISVIYPTARIITIEDTAELDCKSESYLGLHSSEKVSARRLVKVSMRLRPDWLFMGEVRDDAALDMVSALGTGHPGGTTVHGGSFAGGFSRIRQLCKWKGENTIDPEMISDAIPNVILMERLASGKRAPTAIGKVDRWDGSRYHFNTTARLGRDSR
jgi:Flp pilus assembly CpaF family ATPase